MTELPGNRIPPEALPPGGSSTPAQDAQLPPFWCRHSVQWSWVGDKGGYLCDDPQHFMSEEAFIKPGMIPAEHLPPYAHPPNEAQLQKIAHDDLMAQHDAILDWVDKHVRHKW